MQRFCHIRSHKTIMLSLVLMQLTTSLLPAQAQKPRSESDYYALKTIPIPEQVKLEVGGLAALPDALAPIGEPGAALLVPRRAAALQTTCKPDGIMTLPWMAAKILLRPVAELRPHAGNARVHSAAQLEQ
ncbi:MAG: hypothetical protein RJA02_1682, partial [Armatimonadota bacterium]